MTRGDIFLVKKPSSKEPRPRRAFVVVSRQVLIESRYATVICAPVYTDRAGLATQVPVGIEDGLKHDSAIHCDELISLQKAVLTDYIGTLGEEKAKQLNYAIKVALALD